MKRRYSVTAAGIALLLLGSRAGGQYLWWNLEGQKEATCLYGEITVLATHDCK